MLRITLMAGVLALVGCMGNPLPAGRMERAAADFYVAPMAMGSASGKSPDDAAEFHDARFWAGLARQPATVWFLDGTYIAFPALELKSQTNLVLRVQHLGKVLIRDDPADTQDKNNLLSLKECQDITIAGLTFTGSEKIGAATKIMDCRNITIEECTWTDLPGAFYAALSPVGAKCADITVSNCTFARVGSGSHAHMIYSAYGVQRLTILNCRFEDCAGDFVRFRDETDYGVVYGCSFKSTGTFRDANPPMITVPLFNDDNPASRPAKPNYEYFGTHFLFAGNSFEYPANVSQGPRPAIVFHHSGYDPPGRHHLLSPDEAQTLRSGSIEVRKRLLLDHMGIDMEHVHIFNNTFVNVAAKVIYRCSAQYGAASRGFDGNIDISDLVNTRPAVADVQQAARYFRPAATVPSP